MVEVFPEKRKYFLILADKNPLNQYPNILLFIVQTGFSWKNNQFNFYSALIDNAIEIGTIDA